MLLRGLIMAVATSAVAANAALAGDDLVSDIDLAAAMASNIQTRAASINDANFLQVAPALHDDLQTLEETISEDNNGLVNKRRRQAASPYDEPEQDGICGAFHQFTSATSSLFNTIGSKSSVYKMYFLDQEQKKEMLEDLESLQTDIDAYATGIIALVPDCSESANENKISLDQVMKDTILAYS